MTAALPARRTHAHRARRQVDVYHHMGRSLNIAYMEGCFEDDAHVYMVLELCRGGQLW